MRGKRVVESDVMTAKEAATYLHISESTLDEADAKIRPAVTPGGGKRLYRRRWLNEYLENSKREG